MPTRDIFRYIVALVVGVLMFISGSSTWSAIGAAVVVLTVLAFVWHRALLARQRSQRPS